MTLLITVVSNNGLWQSTDHKLTQVGGKEIPDQSVKNIFIEEADGKAMIAYAGVGKVGNMQISGWVRAVLRGTKRNLDDHLKVLLNAANRELTSISKSIGTPHTFSIAAYKNGRPVLYVITNRLSDGKPTIGDDFVLKTITLEETRSRVLMHLEGQGVMAISEAEAKAMIAKTIQRRAAKTSLGNDVAAVLARLNAKASCDERF